MIKQGERMTTLNRQKTDRQPAIDIFKFIAAILVVTIHTDPLLETSETANFFLVHIIARVAVPFFIVCTGFFVGKKIHFDDNGVANTKEARIAILKSSWKFFKLYLICSVIYLFLSIPSWISTGWFSYKAFIDWGLSFFLTGSYIHLWYLMEVCYALLILALILPILKKPLIYLLIIVLWIIEVLDYAYVVFLPSGIQNVFSMIDRFQMPFESIVRVLPLLLLGIIIRLRDHRNTLFSVIGLVISFTLLVFEVIIIKELGGEKYSYLLSTLPVAYFVFTTIHSFDSKVTFKNTTLLADISTFIYLAHPAYILLLRLITKMPNIIEFIIVTSISIVTGYLYYKIKDHIITHKKDKIKIL